MTRTRVLLVDDHKVVVEGLRHLLAAEREFEVVAEATRSSDALVAAERERPDLIILDLRLPDGLAPELCRELRRIVPRTRIVILTAFEDPELLKASLEAGAVAALIKDVAEDELLRSLRAIRSGQAVVDERIQEHPAERSAHFHDQDGQVYAPLTAREYDVLRLLARGMTGPEIAQEIHLAHNTVRSYCQSLLSKLQAHSRIEALATARSLRLV